MKATRTEPSRVRAREFVRDAAAVALLLLSTAARAQAQDVQLFRRVPSDFRSEAAFEIDPRPESSAFDLELSFPTAQRAAPRFDLGLEEPDAAASSPAAAIPARRCVLLQCVDTTVGAPPGKLFTTPVSLWTATALLLGVGVALEGPADTGFHHFSFTDEGFFQTWTYAGGADKASHFVVCADIAGLLDDAYRLNRLGPDQSAVLAFASSLMAGLFVEIGDGLTPYGFSAQDLTADALGAASEVLLKRYGLDDLIGFRLGLVPTTIPPAITQDRVFSGIQYANQIFTADLKLASLEKRLGTAPNVGRFFLFSFVFLTKGYGYEPPIPTRYQEIGFEIGLNFPEILKAVGVRSSTWWGDCLLRAFDFFRIPFTQVGVYYNLRNQKWYGPSAPYQYY